VHGTASSAGPVSSSAARLRHVVNNQRFCVLPDASVANLASAVLSRAMHRLSGDYSESWGYPALIAETFTDPSRWLLPRHELRALGQHRWMGPLQLRLRLPRQLEVGVGEDPAP
jgi:hypothetical protein